MTDFAAWWHDTIRACYHDRTLIQWPRYMWPHSDTDHTLILTMIHTIIILTTLLYWQTTVLICTSCYNDHTLILHCNVIDFVVILVLIMVPDSRLTVDISQAFHCAAWNCAIPWMQYFRILPRKQQRMQFSQGGLTITSTTYILNIHLNQRKTLEMGIGKSLMLSQVLKRRSLKWYYNLRMKIM